LPDGDALDFLEAFHAPRLNEFTQVQRGENHSAPDLDERQSAGLPKVIQVSGRDSQMSCGLLAT